MEALDPILYEYVKIDDWLKDKDNIIIIVDDQQLKFSPFKRQLPIFALNKNFLFIPDIKEILVECIYNRNNLLPKESYNNKITYNNIGFFMNKSIIIQNNNNYKQLFKNDKIFQIVLEDKINCIQKDRLELAIIGIKPLKKIDKNNIKINVDSYFDKLIAEALKIYSGSSYITINTYLAGKYVLNNFNQKIIDNAIKNISLIDKAFNEAAPINETNTKYYRGMKNLYQNFNKKGDKILINNYTSISKSLNVALNFTSYSNGAIYKIELDKGMPFIDMELTTHFKNEKEILLPRNIMFEFLSEEIYEKPTIGNLIYKYKLINVLAYPLNNTINRKSVCKDYYLGSIKSITLNDIKLFNKKYAISSENKNNKNISMKLPRCPNGSYRDKKTKKCIPKKNINNENNKNSNNSMKLPRCPNGSRRDKITKKCVPK